MLILSINIFKEFQFFCFNFGIYLLGILFILVPFMYFIIGRKFDVLFKRKAKEDPLGIFDPGIVICNEIARFTVYALCITFYKHIKNPNSQVSFDYDAFFDHYDFRKNANKLQIILSLVYVYGGLAFIIFSAIGIIPTWITQGFNWVKGLSINNFFI